MEIQLSSHKNENGLPELLSNNPLQFWHTDDNLPHYLSILFTRRTYVKEIKLFLSYSRDDSYTPEVLELWSGLVREAVKLDHKFEYTHPEGYVTMPLGKEVFYIYIVIRLNHQEGRDSRVRNIKVYNEDGMEIFCKIN